MVYELDAEDGAKKLLKESKVAQELPKNLLLLHFDRDRFTLLPDSIF